MNSTPSKLVNITKKTTASSLSKSQKLFHKLIKKIDTQRAQLLTWQAAISSYQQKYTGDYQPLEQVFRQKKIQFLLLLDASYGNKIFTKTDKNKLTDIICNVAFDLQTQIDADEVKEIFNKYSGEDFDAQKSEADEMSRMMMKDMYGLEIDDDVDINDPLAMFEMLAKQAQELDEKELAQREMMGATAKPRKKTAKQIEKETKLAEEEKNISLSIREVYRKLASTLHPDRETDETERTRKTALMQRVNMAYSNRNLLQLLELQLEIEQIDESMVNEISGEKLRHYNKILTEQSHELDDEIVQNCMAFALRHMLDPNNLTDPAFLLMNINNDIHNIKQNIRSIDLDLEAFQQVSEIKIWLKSYRINRSYDRM